MDKVITPEEFYFNKVAELKAMSPEELLKLQTELLPELNNLVNGMCIAVLMAIVKQQDSSFLERFLVASLGTYYLCKYKLENLTPSEN